MSNTRRNTLSILFLLVCLSSFSQKKDSISNPLEQLFQESFDSTISYHGYSNWGEKGDYYFIGKKNDSIYYYRYFNPRNQSPKLQFGPLNSKIYTSYYFYLYNRKHIYNPYLNFDDKFFFVKSEKLSGSLWESIQKINLWDMVDENNENLFRSRMIIMDGGEYVFKLITNNEVKKLYYISPEDYPINDINKVRNRINEVIELIYIFYKNHKIEFNINQ
jgi:hypothetical protein